jgi:galactose mutarotase-like enzyme
MENDLVRVVVLLDQGSDIICFEYKPLGLDLLWNAPSGGVLSPGQHITSRPLAEGNFADFHEGGWQECFPNGGRVCTYRGTEFGLHGEVFGLPWACEIVADSAEEVAARLTVRTRRTPFVLEKTLRLRDGLALLEIEETVRNEGRHPMEFMWGHHPAFGEPFLSGACVVTTGAKTAVLHDGDDPESRFSRPLKGAPASLTSRSGATVNALRVPARDEVVSDMLYLTDLDEGFYALTNTGLGIGFAMEFDPCVFSCIWYWIACNAPGGAPFHGRSYAVALEPFTSWPAILTNAIANGTQRNLGPGEALSTRLTAGVFASHEPPATARQISYHR